MPSPVYELPNKKEPVKLSLLIKQKEFASPSQEAILNIIATESWLMSEISAQLAPHGVTPNQYNVLRILRGSHPKPCRCAEIGDRLLDRTPDVTRLLVRIQKAGLVSRQRAAHDRRIVEVSITEKGLDLLSRLDEPMNALQDRVTKHLSSSELRSLSDMLDKVRTDQQV